MKILLAIDGSDYSKATVSEIALRSFPLKTKICIVSAYEKASLITAMGPMNVPQDDYIKADQYALMIAKNATEMAVKILRAKNSTLTITAKVVEGNPKRVILEEAETFGADLIVVGSHGSGAIERFLMGSVSQAVALYAKCSVEIVRIKIKKPIKSKRK